MKKLIIKESVVDGKMSKAELLLNVLFKDEKNIEITMPNRLYDYFIKHSSNEQIEELADDLGYWQDTGNYEYDLNNAKNKMLYLSNWIVSTYKTLSNKNVNFYWLSFILHHRSIFNLQTRIKLLLYAFVFYKNPRLIDKKMTQLTGWNYNKIVNYIENLVDEDTSNDVRQISNELHEHLLNLPFYIEYYTDGEITTKSLITTLLTNKTHRKNKTKL